MSMKILLVKSGLFVGGQERQMLELGRGLIARGHTVDVAVPFAGDHQQGTFESSGMTVIPLLQDSARSWSAVVRALRVPRRLLRLREVMREGGYDVVNGYGAASNIYASAAGPFLSAKVVWGIRDSIPLESRLLRLLERAALPAADLIIASSPAGRMVCLERGLPEDRTIVIENGIEMTRFRIEPTWRADARQDLGVADGEVLIGTIGRVQPVKNIEGFLAACAVVAAKRPHARFLVMGPGSADYVGQLESLAERLGIDGRMVWRGPRDDVERYFNALDVFVSATRHKEGMMNVAIEAMACGTPCVVTNMGSVAEVIGELGEVVGDDDPDTIARAIEAVLARADGWSREELRASVVHRFDSGRLAARTEREFERLLRGA